MNSEAMGQVSSPAVSASPRAQTFKRKVPLYFHVESLLRQKIVTGQLPAGDKIGTEKELVAQFGVSQITIRAALANLEAEGLILRKPGKGTFVAPHVPSRKQVIVTRDVQSFVLDSESYEVSVLGIELRRVQETRIAQAAEAFFGLRNQDALSVIRRVRLLDGRPVSFIENFCLPDVASHLSVRELAEEPLQRILQRKLNLRIGKSEAFLESVPADPDVAKIVHTHVFTPLFLLQGYLRFASGEPFEIVNLFMRPDCFKYRIDFPQE
jgi:GntR family transcriptional regulator